MNKNKKIIMYVSLLILLFLGIMLVRNYKDNDKYLLDEVKLSNDKKINNKNLAIMIQKEDGTGYEESDTFLTGYELNTSLSGCIDKNGDTIDGAVEYNVETMNLNLKAKGSSYCYLYFDIAKKSYLGEYLLENPSTGLNITLEGGLYRYQGINNAVNNYVCFGTSNKNECLENTDAYMYRIIGITEDNYIKLIKKTSIGIYQWYANMSLNIPWYQTSGDSSTLYTTLNGTDFLENETYIPTGWENLVADTIWKYGDVGAENKTPSAMYSTEQGLSNSVTAKVGLMYISDYYYAYQSGGLNCSANSSSYSTCLSSWLHLSQNDTEHPSCDGQSYCYPTYEWTMLRYGYVSAFSAYTAMFIADVGYVTADALRLVLSVRPVFYLISDTQYISGSGISTDPFIIS